MTLVYNRGASFSSASARYQEMYSITGPILVDPDRISRPVDELLGAIGHSPRNGLRGLMTSHLLSNRTTDMAFVVMDRDAP